MLHSEVDLIVHTWKLSSATDTLTELLYPWSPETGPEGAMMIGKSSLPSRRSQPHAPSSLNNKISTPVCDYRHPHARKHHHDF
jgi:hypothetical protein